VNFWELNLLKINRSFHPDRIRKTILDMAYAGSTVHIGCAFSIVELLSVLYRNHLRYPGNNPRSSDRDYLVLSKGHGVMAQYACMRELGWLKDSDIQSYFSDGTHLKGLSDSRVPGLEVTSGSLGHGFSVGVGIAFGHKLRGTDQKIFVLVGDGELNEGPIWEGALFSSHHGLTNFMVIVDINEFQAMGTTEEVLSLGDINAKFRSFGFVTKDVDGHDEAAVDQAINELWESKEKSPRALLARTVKGKGVPFMENNNEWHYTRLNQQTYERAISSLSLGGIE